MRTRIESEAHLRNAERKANPAMQAIRVVAGTMVELGAKESETEALAYILASINPIPGTVAATREAEVWAMIGLAAGHLTGVQVNGPRDVGKLPTYNTSKPLIIERLTRELEGPAVEVPSDPFEGLLS